MKVKHILFSIFFVLFCTIPLFGKEWITTVKFVPDGDTFIDFQGIVYRLKGIDAPEIAHKDKPAQYYSYRSKKLLKSIIWHKKVKIITIGEKRDRFNRILAYVFLPDGTFVNEYMLLKGAAFCFPHPFQEESIIERFLIAQRRAIDKKEGFWGYILSIPAAQDRYIGNRRSKRFHTLSCGFGKNISKRNRVWFVNLKDAFWRGYAPCRRCTPWPIIKK